MWVFGYGSLVWNPGFDTAERVIARLPGYRRSFCMRSIHHRGTPEAPGLVLALDAVAGGACEGVALRAEADRAGEVLAYLRERELISSAYLERRLEVAQIIARARGGRGPNTEYLFNTTTHLQELGLHDGELDWLVRRVRALCG
jgi:cation transport protein ChaC